MASTTSTERQEALFGLWKVVNEIADTTEDHVAIRNLIAEAGIAPKIHVGTAPADFTPAMVAEWALGNWADIIDSGSLWMLNTARNVSIHQYEKVVLGRDA